MQAGAPALVPGIEGPSASHPQARGLETAPWKVKPGKRQSPLGMDYSISLLPLPLSPHTIQPAPQACPSTLLLRSSSSPSAWS